MKRVKQAVRTVLLAALFCVMLTVPAFAVGDGSVWATLSETSDGTTALIVTDTTVTDGVVALTYDSSVLTYEGVEVDEAYVAMYAVNAEEEGVVRISWVAPGEFTADASGTALIRVNFTGEGAISLSGEANNGEGASVPVKGVEEPSEPTEPSEPAEPTEPSEPTEPTEPSEPTEPTEPSEPTEPTTPEDPGSSGSRPGTGDSANLILPIAVMVCAAGAIVVLVVIKRRAAK